MDNHSLMLIHLSTDGQVCGEEQTSVSRQVRKTRFRRKLHRTVLAYGYGSRLGRLGEWLSDQLPPVLFTPRWIHTTVEWMCSLSAFLALGGEKVS